MTNESGKSKKTLPRGVEAVRGSQCWDAHIDFLSAAVCTAPLVKALQEHPEANRLLPATPEARDAVAAAVCARPLAETTLSHAQAGSLGAKAGNLIDAARDHLIKGVAASMCTSEVLDAFKAVAKAEPALRGAACPGALDDVLPDSAITHRKRQNIRDLSDSAKLLGEMADKAKKGQLIGHIKAAACWEPLAKALDAANCVAPILREMGRKPDTVKAALRLKDAAPVTAADCVARAVRRLDDVRAAVCTAAAGTRLSQELTRFKDTMTDAVGSAVCAAPMRRMADAAVCTRSALSEIAGSAEARKRAKDAVPQWATDAALDKLGELAAASPNLRKLGFT